MLPVRSSSCSVSSFQIPSRPSQTEVAQARDTLTVWRTLAQQIGKIEGAPPAILGDAAAIEEAREFAAWMAAHPTELAAVQVLELREKGLTSLPAEIGQLSNLCQLDLRDNQLTTLPEAIGQLQQLTFLRIQANRFTELPSCLRALKALKVLIASTNQISLSPNCLPDGLEQLSLRDNALCAVPEGSLPATLTVLNLSENVFTVWPEAVSSLTRLQTLFFSENLLETLPPSIGQLSELEQLYLTSNRLAAFPSEVINQWTHLMVLDVSADPLINGAPNPQNSLCIDPPPQINGAPNSQNSLEMNPPPGKSILCGSNSFRRRRHCNVVGLEHPSHFALSGQFRGQLPLGAPLLTLVPLERFPVVDVRGESAPASSVSAQPALAGRIAAMPPLGQIAQLANSIAAGSPISVGPSSRGAGVSGNLPNSLPNSLRGHVDSASTSMPQSASRVVSAPRLEEKDFRELVAEVSGTVYAPDRPDRPGQDDQDVEVWEMLFQFCEQCQQDLTWPNLLVCALNAMHCPSRHYNLFENLVLSQMVRALERRAPNLTLYRGRRN